MGRLYKLLAKFRQNPKNVRFHELETVLERLGFVRVKTNAGSHFKWSNRRKDIKFSAPYQNPVKPVYIINLLKIVEEYFLLDS